MHEYWRIIWYTMENDVLSSDREPEYTGKDILYRERGVTAIGVQRAADALLRVGQKPSVAAVRAHLGGGSPNTVGPLLERYWQGLGQRLPAGPDALERVPESLARMTEALWLRSLDEARERAKSASSAGSAAQQTTAALEGQVATLTAALAESCAKLSEAESELLTSVRERLELREQVRQLTALLGAEQQLRARDRDRADARGRELEQRRAELREVARRRLAAKGSRQIVAAPRAARRKSAKARKKNMSARPKVTSGKSRTKRLVRQGHR